MKSNSTVAHEAPPTPIGADVDEFGAPINDPEWVYMRVEFGPLERQWDPGRMVRFKRLGFVVHEDIGADMYLMRCPRKLHEEREAVALGRYKEAVAQAMLPNNVPQKGPYSFGNAEVSPDEGTVASIDKLGALIQGP